MPSPHAPQAHDGSDRAYPGVILRWDEVLDDSGAHPLRGGQAPLVDQQALRELEEDFSSPAVAQNFARDFVRSWEGKYQRLEASVHRHDQERAAEAALSMKVTSMMVGAVRLAQLTQKVEQLIDRGDMDATARTLAHVEECGSDTRVELLDTYLR